MKKLIFVLFLILTVRHDVWADSPPTFTQVGRLNGVQTNLVGLSDGTSLITGLFSKDLSINTDLQNIALIKNGAIKTFANGLPGKSYDATEMTNGDLWIGDSCAGGLALLKNGTTTFEFPSPLTVAKGFRLVERINDDELLVAPEGVQSVNGIPGKVFIVNTKTWVITLVTLPADGTPQRFVSVDDKILITYSPIFSDGKSFVVFNKVSKTLDESVSTLIPANISLIQTAGHDNTYYVAGYGNDFHYHVYQYKSGAWNDIAKLITGGPGDLICLNGKVYLSGFSMKFDKSTTVDDMYIFDETTDLWTPANNSFGMAFLTKTNQTITGLTTDNGQVYQSDIATGIKNNQVLNLKVFPNPVTNYLYITSPDAREIPLFAFSGQTIDIYKIIPGQNTFDMSFLTKGIYIIGNEKFIKE